MTAVHGEPRPAKTGHGWTVDDSTFGARLALVRQRMQWNVKEAARECGIPAASWGTWEGGAMPRRYTEMCRLIAERTGCDFGWLALGPHGKGAAAEPTVTYSPLAERLTRPRDNRPPGRGPAVAVATGTAAPGRTAYLPRRRRDR